MQAIVHAVGVYKGLYQELECHQRGYTIDNIDCSSDETPAWQGSVARAHGNISSGLLYCRHMLRKLFKTTPN